ncbi:ribosomal protein L1 [Flagelloscypha sp. PMI_526]|nr:ribosomal protein L1 [Flagelloscypha sp. PMI_526]
MPKSKTKSATLIDSHVSSKQAKTALDTLHSHERKKLDEKEETELLGAKLPFVWLNVTVKKIPSAFNGFKVFKVPVKHTLVDPREHPICLLTKDPQRTYKDLLEKKEIKFVSRVIGVNKLKGKFKPFDVRRQLLKDYGLFLADDRIIPLLPRLLGSKWADAKKQPIPVDLTKKDLKTELERAVNSTFMHQNQGTCTSIKIGLLSHSPDQLLDNLTTALPVIVSNIKDGWSNIHAIHVKTNDSPALPIWIADPEAPIPAPVPQPEAIPAKSKGKKREPIEESDEDSDDEEEEKEKPKKKKARIDVDPKAALSKKAASAVPVKPSSKKDAQPSPVKNKKGAQQPLSSKPKSSTKSDSKSTKEPLHKKVVPDAKPLKEVASTKASKPAQELPSTKSQKPSNPKSSPMKQPSSKAEAPSPKKSVSSGEKKKSVPGAKSEKHKVDKKTGKSGGAKAKEGVLGKQKIRV